MERYYPCSTDTYRKFLISAPRKYLYAIRKNNTTWYSLAGLMTLFSYKKGTTGFLRMKVLQDHLHYVEKVPGIGRPLNFVDSAGLQILHQHMDNDYKSKEIVAAGMRWLQENVIPYMSNNKISPVEVVTENEPMTKAPDIKFFQNKKENLQCMVVMEDEPWFVALYIVQSLQYNDTVSHIVPYNVTPCNFKKMPRDHFRALPKIPKNDMVCLNVNGVMELLRNSKKRMTAARIEQWLKKDVLPALYMEEIEDEQVEEPTVEDTSSDPQDCSVQMSCESAESNIFTHPDFGNLTVLEIDGEPWFIGKEVAEKLGYSNVSKAITQHVDDEDMITRVLPYSQNGKTVGKLNLINESGVYSLILRSKLPLAKQFKRWVTSEVLPSIRKHGAYMTPQTLTEALARPENMLVLLQTLQNEQTKNRELTAANAALAKDENTWDKYAVLNALMRSYGHANAGNFAMAWNMFYKRLRYKYGISIKHRAAHDKNKKNLLYYLAKEELPAALSVATAMCEECGLNTGKIINETNYDMVKKEVSIA